MPLVDLSAPIVASPPETPEPLRTEIAFHDHAAGAAAIEALLGVPRACCATARAGRPRSSCASAPTTPRTSTRRTTTTRRSRRAGADDRRAAARPLPRARRRLDFTAAPTARRSPPPTPRRRSPRRARPAARATSSSSTPGATVPRRAGLHDPRPGVTAEATRWLFDRGVRVMGIDAWGWDAPAAPAGAEAKERDEAGIFWAAHQAALPYCPDRAPGRSLARCRPRASKSPASLFGSPRQRRACSRRRDRARLMPSPSDPPRPPSPSARPRRAGRVAARDRAVGLRWRLADTACCASSTAATAGRRRCGPAPPAGSRSTGAGRRDRPLGAGRRPRVHRGASAPARALAALGQRRADHRRAGERSHEGSVAWYRTRLRVPRTGRYALRFESANHRRGRSGSTGAAWPTTSARTCPSRSAAHRRRARPHAGRARGLALARRDEAPPGTARGSTSAASTAR
jgi:hypothetical protein